MKSRIVVIAIAILLSIIYTELRLYETSKIIAKRDNETINAVNLNTKDITVLKNNIDVILKDFYYEGKQ